MTLRIKKHLSLTGIHTSELSKEEMIRQFKQIVLQGIHGLCFSIYEDGQKPGDSIAEDQIRKRIEIIQPYTNWIRSFSCIDGNEHVPRIAKEYGLNTLVGAWLSDDLVKNNQEIDGLLKLAAEGFVDIAAVGNEVLYRGDLSEEQLIKYIIQVKNQIGAVPVGYVDAYYEFSDRPEMTSVCDVILSNCYPFWEGCHIDYALVYMKEMYHQALDAGKGKKVIITETGWPSSGGAYEASKASSINFLKYFIDAQNWSLNDGIEMFYFSSFDEGWKVGSEGEVGAYWGLWDNYGVLKF
jgi:exo-beta-1,3-glucanase (GH17 family)